MANKIIDNLAVPAAGTFVTDPFGSSKRKEWAAMQANLTYGAGGTSIKVFLQTTFDDGPLPITWRDVACLAFLVAGANKLAAVTTNVAATVQAAATDGTLADDTINQGILGVKYRIKYIIAGTYTTSFLTVSVEFHEVV